MDRDAGHTPGGGRSVADSWLSPWEGATTRLVDRVDVPALRWPHPPRVCPAVDVSVVREVDAIAAVLVDQHPARTDQNLIVEGIDGAVGTVGPIAVGGHSVVASTR